MLEGIHTHIQEVHTHTHIYREVMGGVDKTKSMLIEKLNRQMENTLVLASNTTIPGHAPSDINHTPSPAYLMEQYRGVAHCVRGLDCVGALKVVKDILKDTIMPAILK